MSVRKQLQRVSVRVRNVSSLAPPRPVPARVTVMEANPSIESLRGYFQHHVADVGQRRGQQRLLLRLPPLQEAYEELLAVSRQGHRLLTYSPEWSRNMAWLTRIGATVVAVERSKRIEVIGRSCDTTTLPIERHAFALTHLVHAQLTTCSAARPLGGDVWLENRTCQLTVDLGRANWQY